MMRMRVRLAGQGSNFPALSLLGSSRFHLNSVIRAKLAVQILWALDDSMTPSSRLRAGGLTANVNASFLRGAQR